MCESIDIFKAAIFAFLFTIINILSDETVKTSTLCKVCGNFQYYDESSCVEKRKRTAALKIYILQ